MRIEKNRHIMIFHALMNADDIITASELARVTMSSIRTIKSDIAYFNPILKKENIARIDPHKGKGYQIVVKDEQKYKEFHDNIKVLYSLFYGRSIESVNRRMYILQRFLIDEYVKIEDLCDELYLSRSSIRKDIAWTVSFLKTYHLNLEAVTGKGYHVFGKEQDLRGAMVELRCSQYHEFQPLYPYDPFDDEFRKEGRNHYEELRKAFLDILRSSRIVVSDIETKKITSHLCLMYKRTRQGKLPELDKEIIEELKETYDYEVAKEIFANKTIREYVEAPDMEIVNFARILISNRDINIRVNGTTDLPEKLVEENGVIYDDIVNDMRKVIGSRLLDTDFFRIYRKDFESLQLQLYLKHHFDHTGKKRFVTYLEGNEDLFSPIPLELTRATIARLQKKFEEPINDSCIMAYVGVYERLLKKVIYPYKKLRLAVSGTEGLVYSQHISESLLDINSYFIESVDVFNLYEMRKVNFDNYDALVHSGNILYYKYPLPLVNYRELDYNRDAGEMFEKLFRYGFDQSEMNRIKQVMNINTGERIRDHISFIEALSYRYGTSSENQKHLYRQYTENIEIIDHYYPRNGILMYFMPYIFVQREIIDIYIPEQTVYYRENMEIKAVIAVSIDPEKNLADLKICDHVLRYICQVPNTLEELCNGKEEALDKIFYRIIERKFLNR